MTRAEEIFDIPVPSDGGQRVYATSDARWDARSYLLIRGQNAVVIDANGHLAPLLTTAVRANVRFTPCC